MADEKVNVSPEEKKAPEAPAPSGPGDPPAPEHTEGPAVPGAELEKAVNDRGISSRTMRTAKSRIGDRLVTEKNGASWICHLRE